MITNETETRAARPRTQRPLAGAVELGLPADAPLSEVRAAVEYYFQHNRRPYTPHPCRRGIAIRPRTFEHLPWQSRPDYVLPIARARHLFADATFLAPSALSMDELRQLLVEASHPLGPLDVRELVPAGLGGGAPWRCELLEDGSVPADVFGPPARDPALVEVEAQLRQSGFDPDDEIDIPRRSSVLLGLPRRVRRADVALAVARYPRTAWPSPVLVSLEVGLRNVSNLPTELAPGQSCGALKPDWADVPVEVPGKPPITIAAVTPRRFLADELTKAQLAWLHDNRDRLAMRQTVVRGFARPGLGEVDA